MKNHNRIAAFVLALGVISFGYLIPVQAEGYFHRHPYQQKAAIGAGVGAAAGAVLGGKHHRGSGALKGAAVGGVAGTGYEFLKRH